MEEKTYPIPKELLVGRGAEVWKHSEKQRTYMNLRMGAEVGGFEETPSYIFFSTFFFDCLPLFSLCLQLFDHVSESLRDFLHEKNISSVKKHPLAFTFSFPCEQSTLDQVMTLHIFCFHSCTCSLCDSVCLHITFFLSLQGFLLNWSKNYRVRGLQGKDVVQALRDAIDRTGVGRPFIIHKLLLLYLYDPQTIIHLLDRTIKVLRRDFLFYFNLITRCVSVTHSAGYGCRGISHGE